MTTRRYAEGTTVDAGRSLDEIRKLVKGAGATNWTHGEDDDAGISWVRFRIKGFPVQFIVKLPTKKDAAVRYTPAGRLRADESIPAAIEQETKRRWRELALLVKAKIVASNSGVVKLEDELMSYIMLDSGESVADYVMPRLAQLQASARGQGETPLLPPAVVVEEEQP